MFQQQLENKREWWIYKNWIEYSPAQNIILGKVENGQDKLNLSKYR